MAQDSATADFWDQRYRGGVTPWEHPDVPPALQAFLAREAGVRLRVLVPGCGSAHELRLLHAQGHTVLAIDFADAALEAARRALGPLADLVKKADFFAFEGDAAPFDLAYERAFLCALPRRLWEDWAQRMATLVRPGGRLAGFFFFDTNERGPPFGLAPAQLRGLLEPAFECIEDVPVPPQDSLPVFAGREHWQVWQRRL